MQKNKPKDILDFDTYVEEGLVASLKKGDKFAIPTGYFHTFINADTIPVLFTRVYKENGLVDYKNLQRENGLAYYCIRKNAKMEIVHNPMYKDIPAIKKVKPAESIVAFGLKESDSLYSQLRGNCKVFETNLWG